MAMTHVTLIGASLRLERCKETTKDHVGSAMGAIYIYNIEAGNLLIDKNEGKQNTCIVDLASYVRMQDGLHRASIRYTSIKETN
jgi:hypothetical protein